MLIPFSFITFVLREEVKWDDSSFYFDPEQYNFLFNKKTVFTLDRELVLQSNDYLQYVLQSFDEIDPVLFDLLQCFLFEKSKHHHHHGFLGNMSH